MKKIVVLALALVLASSYATQAFAEKMLKFSHAAPRTSVWHDGATKFAEIVKAKTNGKFDFTIFPLDELSGGNQVAGIELVQTGVTDVHLTDALVWSAIAKEAIVPCFPWLLPTTDDVDKYMNGAGGEALKKALSKSGVVPLAIGENGYRQIVNNRNPVRTPADMKGLKMRVPGSSVHVNLLKYIGADPLTMNQSEVYTSLQQGTIDACENTLDLLVSQNTLEVTKYLSFWNYSYDPLFLTVSQDLWDSLNDGEKKIFQDAANEAMAYQVVQSRIKEKELRKNMGNFKVEVVESLTPEQVAAFQKAVAPIYEDNKKQFGELFKAFGYTK